MSLTSPSAGWFHKQVSKDEKMWVLLSLALCLMLFFWMIAWHVWGNQNPSSLTYRAKPKEFVAMVESFTKKYMIGTDNGVPVVMPDPKKDVFMLAEQWRWTPVLVLQKGEWYKIHMSSKDVMHGFSIQPVNMNFMVYPDYDYVLSFKPTEAGDFRIVCNEFCGIGHHQMLGRIVVIENDEDLKKYNYDKASLTERMAKVAAGGTVSTAAPQSEAEMAAAGKELFALKACSACHTLDGKKLVAPTWKGLFGSEEEVMDEQGNYSKITINEEYLRESIRFPDKKKVKGYEKIPMTVVPLTDVEVEQLIAFIKTVR